MGDVMIQAQGLSKTFTLHTQGGVEIPVFRNLDFLVAAGECVALCGQSGSGKSTLLRTLYANYKLQAGTILVRHRDGWVDMGAAPPRQISEVRRRTMGYVSQFLRVIPRVPTEAIVAEPLLALGAGEADALVRAHELLARLNVPERLWSIAPATFSGGEQQRVNVARGFAADFPILLLDEPTASLDADNRQIVIDLIKDAKERGVAVVGIFHDDAVRSAVADRNYDMLAFRTAA